HERVVAAVMARGAVLPLRFGTAMTDERSLVALLSERHDDFVAALERVRGRVELGVRATPDRDAADRDSGRAYLLARAREQRSAWRSSRPSSGCATRTSTSTSGRSVGCCRSERSRHRRLGPGAPAVSLIRPRTCVLVLAVCQGTCDGWQDPRSRARGLLQVDE